VNTQTDESVPNIIPCFSCGANLVYKGRQGELNGRFCSMRCQDYFDAGNQPPASGRPPILMKPTRDGFKITCPSCQQDFESKGLRCCSDKCERRYRERQENEALMAEAGMEPAIKRKCENPTCTKTIPKWRNRRAVSRSVRFCSPRCSKKAKRATEQVSKRIKKPA
jgi:hypothetical protein